MARLEIDIALKNAGSASSGIDNFAKRIEDAQASIKGLVAQGRQLDGAMMTLSNSFKSGAISESTFNKESQKLSLQLSKNRQDLASKQNALRSYNATLAQSANASRSLGTAQKQLQAYSNDFTSGIRSANGVTLEFTRILQDAPYGMQGVANNLQQLFTNFGYYSRAAKEAAAAQGQVVSGGQLIGGLFRNLISPANLLTLGVSALTAGWVAYEHWQQRSNKAAKEAEDPIRKLIENLSILGRNQYEAARASGAEAAELRILYQAATSATQSTEDRRNAARQLIKQYPEQFKNMGIERTMLGQARAAYDSLSTSILATARAQAAYSKIAEKASEQIAIEETNRELQKQINLRRQQIQQNKERGAQVLGGIGLGDGADLAGDLARQADALERSTTEYADIAKLQKEQAENNKINLRLAGEISALEGEVLKNQGKIIVNDGKRNDGLKQTVDLLQSVRDLNQRAQFSSDIAGTPEGLDTLLKKNEQKYKLYLDNLDKLEERARKGKNIANRAETLTEIDTTRKQIVDNQAEEEQAIRLKYAQDTADAIAAINDKAGITRQRGLQRDLDANKAYYDEQVRQNANNNDILKSLAEARLKEEQNIRNEYTRKDLERAAKQYAAIEKIINKPYSASAGDKKIQEELDKRLKLIEEYYNNIRKILSSAGLPTFYTKILETAAKARATASAPAGNNEFTKGFQSSLRRGLSRTFDGLFNDLGSLSDKRYEIERKYEDLRRDKTEEQIRSLREMERLERSINNGLRSTLSNITKTFSGIGGNLLTSAFSQGIASGDFKDLTKLFKGDSKAVGYGALSSLLGSVLSGSSNSAGAQIGGGILSGAGTGAALGSIIPGLGTLAGAGIGALVGAIGGIFNSSGAKKQRQLQEMQLAEQRKQTALAERAAALAYTSSIIGQQTNQGNVSSVGRNEFGDITFRIQGKDLVASFNREMQSR